MMTINPRFTAAGLAALAVAAPAAAMAAPAAGQIILESRLRYESYSPTGPDATALTERLRLGWRSPTYSGVSLLVEGEAIGALNDGYADGVRADPRHAVIPDPEITELNRAQLEWKPNQSFDLIAGRQRIILGNARFVGNVGWRQNEQTFDAAKLVVSPTKAVTLTYAYIDKVRRPLGRESSQGVWRGEGHVGQAETDLGVLGHGSVYAVLLDIDNAASQSSKTFGARLTGAHPVAAGLAATWEVEYARQYDWGNNPQNFGLNYHVLSAGLKGKTANGALFWERLGGDGVHGFQTPLGTTHGFQGLSDVIGATPGRGVDDVFVRAGATVKVVHPLKLSGEVHDFRTVKGSDRLGREFDATLSAPLAKGWSLDVGVARFDASGSTYPDATRVWTSLEFKL